MATQRKIGKYEVQGVLGTGGMGVVYKGWDPSIARTVAIKSVNKLAHEGSELESALSRFRQEAQAVGRLVHPRIVQIYDYVEDVEGAYIVMELVNGKTLKEFLDQKVHYEISDIGFMIRQILDGIGYAHEYGVVHRDIKPSNIMINSDGRIKINDFGIAHIESSELTQLGDLLGTPHYMSPEQCLGTEVDGLADLFSIGVIAYELLTGSKPFVGNFATVMNHVINLRPTNPSELNPKLAPVMDEVLQKVLSKKREDRYQSASEFSEAFNHAIDISLGVSDVDAGVIAAPPPNHLLNAAKHLSAAANGGQGVAVKNDASEATAGHTQISLDASVRKARILVVDDEERILSALKSLFRHRYHVFCTTDGNKALDFIKRYQMHVIISDQRMPAMLGVDLLRKSREISPRSVRILLTGYSDLAAIVGSINDGEIYRFISKPWDNQSLQTVVGEAVTIGIELANNETEVAELPENISAGVLVIESQEDLFRVTRELVSGICPVHFATDAQSALKVMQAQEIAVLIADIGPGKGELTSMLKLLKQEHPQILTIVTIKMADSELVIDLINHAQIFRILNKPINVGKLKSHLLAALQRYLTFKQAPTLLQEHKVETSNQDAESPAGQKIFESIKSLRGRWFGS